MRQLYLLTALVAVFLFACKKDNQPKPAKPADTAGIPATGIDVSKDSVSFVLNGKVYTANTTNTHFNIGNGGVNQKLAYPNAALPKIFEVVADPDSLMFYKGSDLSGDRVHFEIYFLKKYKKADLVPSFGGLLYNVPTAKELSTLFTIGKHPYAEDFQREQTMDGIVIHLSVDGKLYASHSPLPLHTPSIIRKGFQDGIFEVLRLTANKAGGYNLEAKFNTRLIKDYDENDQTELSQGYLRATIN